MFDILTQYADESPRLARLVNNLKIAAGDAYKDEKSLVGAALRDLVDACRKPDDPMWKEMKTVKATERMQANQVANMAHQMLKGM